MRILKPSDDIYAFYDGRRANGGSDNAGTWVEEGALSLGIASYAIVDGDEAMIYDTHVSLDRAELVRRTLEQRGVKKFTVVLSHWHLDHVAGNGVFSDCDILASPRTRDYLLRHREAIEAGEHEGPPAINPLVMPTRAISERTSLAVGNLEVELIPVDIHSDDATVIWLPGRKVLLAGDTVEDTITYVMEPEKLDVHLTGLAQLGALGAEWVLPSHGSPERIAAGGYSDGLIHATREYVGELMRIREEPGLGNAALRDLLSGPLKANWISYFPPYERVHQTNLRSVSDARP